MERPPSLYARCAGRGTCCVIDLPHPGGAAVVLAVPVRSRTATRPAMQVSARPRTAIIMLHPGRRRPWLASAAHVKCKLHMLRQAYWSRPGPPTDGNRRAFPHGKACSGCGAPLPPPWCTAVRPGPPSGAVQAAGAAPEGRARGCPAGGAPLLGWWASPGPLGMPLPAYKLIQIAYAQK